MVPLPKPKFAETNVPIGKSIADYRKEIIDMQAHVLNDAIDRVSFRYLYTIIYQKYRLYCIVYTLKYSM